MRNNGTTTVSLVSDRTTAITAHWRMRLMSFDGKVLSQAAGEITVAPLSSTQVASYTDAQLLHGADPHATFAVFEWLDGERTVSRNLVFFDQPHQLSLPPADIHATLAPALDGYQLTLTAGSLARDVWVSFGDLDAELSDNAFNLLPGETVTLTVQSKASLDALQHALSVTSLGDVMAAGATQ